mmetsp:Transcript_28829/g.65318  ORF Transcript_28829/g.65318 Transcript_28829/m.65318 type:complete len:136 (+) Transcript_28829:82-489(+)
MMRRSIIKTMELEDGKTSVEDTLKKSKKRARIVVNLSNCKYPLVEEAVNNVGWVVSRDEKNRLGSVLDGHVCVGGEGDETEEVPEDKSLRRDEYSGKKGGHGKGPEENGSEASSTLRLHAANLAAAHRSVRAQAS